MRAAANLTTILLFLFFAGRYSAWGYDTVPPNYPIWAPPQEAAVCTGEKPENFLALSNWGKTIVASVSERLQQYAEWNSHFEDISCSFLVSSKGKIQDLFVWSGKDETNEKLALSVISRSGPFPSPPSFLGRRRLKIDLSYPKVRLFVDDNEHEGLKDRQDFFDKVRKNHLE